jgi:hypothetical protein
MKNCPKYTQRLLFFSLSYRFLIILLTIFCYITGSEYDTSQTAVAQFHPQKDLLFLGGFVRWDSVYFLQIATRPGYNYEQEFAFFPGYPFILYSLTTMARKCF